MQFDASRRALQKGIKFESLEPISDLLDIKNYFCAKK